MEKDLKKIESFTIDHEILNPGLYVSRKDYLSDVITTFDVRMTAPNREAVMSTGVLHAIEHLGATYLRNSSLWDGKIIYFGPMGCRTGFYLIIAGDLKPEDILELLQETFIYMMDYEGLIPGESSKDCGNYADMDLENAKIYAERYYHDVLKHPQAEQLNYPKR